MPMSAFRTTPLLRAAGVEAAAGGNARQVVSYLHRYVYREPPPWPAYRRLSALDTSMPPAVDPSVASWSKLDTSPLPLTPLDVPQNASVPFLAHGLERVLQGGGLHSVYTVSDGPSRSTSKKYPSSKTKAFRTIVPPERIAWDRMPEYVPAKRDTQAHRIASRVEGVRYATSTSSITPTLSALYHLLSNFRETDLVGGLSMRLSELPSNFTKFQKKPVAIEVAPITTGAEDVYSINQHETPQRGPTVLLELGNSIERMLTMEPDEFADRFVLPKGQKPLGDVRPSAVEEQFYHYSVASSMLFRAQIDCQAAPQTQGQSFVFDVKTRAVAPIRYNLGNYKAHETHRLASLRGRNNSYEREFYDMVRSVFIKYALQLRIGRMNGALIAYHNTSELLAIEYVRLAEIESYVYGSNAWADAAFGTSVRLLESIMARVHEAMFAEGQRDRVKVLFSTDRTRRRMTVFAQRLREGVRDTLDFEAYTELESRLTRDTEARADRLRPVGLWHADADIHSSARRGVAVVGAAADITNLGGEKVDFNEGGVRRAKTEVEGNALFNVANHDLSALKDGDFYAWQVDVAPMVDGKPAPKGTMLVGDPSEFELRYRISQIKEKTDYINGLYVLELGRLYLP